MSAFRRELHRVQRRWAAWRREVAWRRFARAHPRGPRECGLVAAYGIGDHLLVLALAPAVQAQHGLAVRWVVGNPRYAFLADLFAPRVGYAAWTLQPGDERFAPDLSGGRFYYAHFPTALQRGGIGRAGRHLLDAYRARLGLAPDAPLAPRRPPDPPELAQAVRTLEAAGLPPGRTALLGIDATTTPTGGAGVALGLALGAALRARGWAPVVNAGPTTPALAGLPSIAAPLPQVRALATAAGAVVTLRSGLSDLTADLACRRVVAYPDVPWEEGSVLGGSTFARYGLADPPLEVVLDPASPDAAAARAAAHVAGG